MRRFRSFVVVATTALIACGIIIFWKHGQPRRVALQSISRLASNLANQRNPELLDTILMPVAIRSQTPAEQQEFIAKVLRDEISPEGVLALKRHSEFGLAKVVFPLEYATWCRQAGVDADNCVAFKMERGGIQAEVLLVREGQTYRIVRCKNVKQMAVNFNHG
jgi:hypothetical protein